ncbi:putative molybdenum cofactor guanylyltransferase [Clostridiales bacterium CHKCI001]|nr:putative molybdenum cofactor guanylyltransferase [Clostridiales bacterium CHKCI001]
MIAGYILTGGKNRRMNGKKKLFLEYEGKPFYQHIVQAFHSFSTIYLSVDCVEPYEMVGLPMIVDTYPNLGPIGGIYSGLKVCKEDALFVTACDMPLINETAVREVIEQYQNRKTLTIIGTNHQIHPLFGIYPKTILPIIEEMIREKNYRVMNLLDFTEVSVVQLKNNSRIAENINTVNEYNRLRGE